LKLVELNQILQKGVIVKVRKTLLDMLNEINNKLNDLKAGKVLDISDLNEEDAKIISRVYSKEYFMKGPIEDKDHKGKYVLAFIKNYRGIKNA